MMRSEIEALKEIEASEGEITEWEREGKLLTSASDVERLSDDTDAAKAGK